MKLQDPNQKIGKKEVAQLILEEFTRELIMNSGGEIFRLEKILDDEKESEREFERSLKSDVVKKEEKTPKKEKEEMKEPSDDNLKEKLENLNVGIKPTRKKIPISLSIPHTPLPPRFQYLKPSPTNVEIDLGKLNPLIKDPLVKVIECNGPNQNVFVSGSMGRKKTAIVLNKDEISNIINLFSKETKIPVIDGVFRVVLGKLIFSAVVSDVVGSKFVIKKMLYSPQFRG